MAEYRAVVWLPNKKDLEEMLLQGRVKPISIWLTERAAFGDYNVALWFRVTSMRRDAVRDSTGFVFYVDVGTVAMSRDENAEQIPFTGVFYSPSGHFPLHWNRIDFPENPLVLGDA